MAEADKEFVENVVKAIVDHPDDVKTKRSVDEMGVLIELTVHPEDMGKIIGKEGRTAKSIRTLLRVLGAKNNARVNLKIIEPEGGREVKVPEEKPEAKEEKPSKTLEEGKATEVV
ncbi:MAG TPA: KH domain-containing protein [Patescibacteria group bacterium]|nr:KH domain-containing protein [Patescibacteria group bacterium]